MVTLGPAAHSAPGGLEEREPGFVDSRLGVHELARRMHAAAVDGGLRLETFVEDAGRDGDERAP